MIFYPQPIFPYQCRAIAAAVYGADDMKLELKVVTASNRFEALQSGQVDVLASWDTHTMERDILEVSTTKRGSPFFYCVYLSIAHRFPPAFYSSWFHFQHPILL